MALTGSIKTNSYSGRYYTLSWTASQSIATNSSTITWAISCAGGSSNWYAERTLKAVINGTTVYSKENRVEREAGTITSGTIVIPHNADGSKAFSASIEVACYTVSVNLRQSGSFTLDEIARQAIITSAPNFNDEENPTIKYNNPLGNAVDNLEVCISLTGSAADVAYRSVEKTGSSYTFSLTDAERNTLRNATTTANSRTVYFYIQTTINGEKYRNYVEKTLSIINANPTVSATITDSATLRDGTNPTGNTSRYIIKGWSNAKYTINATAKKGATIVSRKITCGGKSSTTASGTLEKVENATFVITATDSRGNTVSTTVNKTLIDYFKPTLNIEVSPPSATGSMSITVKGTFFNGSFGSKTNYFPSLTVAIEEDDLIYDYLDIENSLSKSGNNYSYTTTIADLNYEATYKITVSGYDLLLSTVSASQTVKLLPVFDWGENDFNFNVPVNFEKGITGAGVWGEWEPTLNSSAISSYTNRDGWYQKIGNVVAVGFFIKANCNAGYSSTNITIGGLPFKPVYNASGGGTCSGAYVSSGFTFQCWAAGANTTNITARVQQVNHTTATNLATSASGCFYRNSGGEITLSGTITYMTIQ